MALLSQDTRTDMGADMDADGLFRLHSRFVASFLFRLGVGREDLDDWVQEVFLVAHRRGGYVVGPARPTTWLAAIALRVAMKAREQRQMRQRTIQDDVAGEDLPSASASPFDTLAAQQRLRWLLERIEPERRAVFLLFEVEGESCDAIADAMGVPVGTVYSRLHAARRDFNEGCSRLEAIERAAPRRSGGPS